MMRIVLAACLVLASALLFTACDTIPDTQNEEAAELFIGTWPMQSLQTSDVSIGPRSGGETGPGVTFKFRVNYTFEITINPEDGGEGLTLTGNYVIADDSFIIELDTSVPGVGKVPLIFAYEFSGEGAPDDNGPDQLKLITEGESVSSLNTILGSELEGVVTITCTITTRLT